MRATMSGAVSLFMSLDAHAGSSPRVGRQHENVLAAGTCGQHHALRGAEAHFARLQVCDDDDETAYQARMIVSRPNAGENLTLTQFAQIDAQFQQLVRAG